ncbi:MAG TPA: HYR domain-containing protein [Terriglobales bacterium]
MKKQMIAYGALLTVATFVAGTPLLQAAVDCNNVKSLSTVNPNSSGSASVNGVNGVTSFTVDADPGECGANQFHFIFVAHGCAPATISCSVTSSTEAELCDLRPSDPDPSSNYLLGGNFPVGTNTVSCAVTLDTCGCVNCAKATFTVIVQDKQPPVVSVPSVAGAEDDMGQCCATVNYGNQVSVSDNCPGLGCDSCTGPTLNCTPPPGTCFNNGTTTVTCVGRDAAGNTATRTFPVVVTDQQPPVIHTTQDTVVYCVPSTMQAGDGDDDDDDDTGGGGHGHAVRDCNGGCDYRLPVMTDNCPLQNGSTTNTSPNCTPPPGSVFPAGCTRVFCTNNFDVAGNQAVDDAGRPPSFLVCTVNPVEVRFDAPLHNYGMNPRKDHEDKTVTTFKVGDKINAKVDLFDCGTHQLKAAAVSGYTALLEVQERQGSYSNGVPVMELSPFQATYADFGFIMMPSGDDLVYVLDTKNFPKGTTTNTFFFSVKATVRPKSTPQVIVGTAYGVMESKP